MDSIYKHLIRAFPFEPTTDQFEALRALSVFLDPNSKKDVFVLRGYAGTGKTTLVKALVETLFKIKLKYVLMAPTGRAAKVLSAYSGKRSSTIHRAIYQQRANSEGGLNFSLKENKRTNTLFIVDEASMIYSEDDTFGEQNNVLADLIDFCFSSSGCALMFIGDLAQLPPVGSLLSKAISPRRLKENFGLSPLYADMRDVMRQSLDSGVLKNATKIRTQLAEKDYQPQLEIGSDFEAIDGTELEDVLDSYYGRDTYQSSLFITRSNKRANLFNLQIRSRILQRESQLDAGDLLMAVRNNYFWLDDQSDAGFIANGDMLEVEKVVFTDEEMGFKFAQVDARLIDYPEMPAQRIMLILDSLTSEGPSLSQEQQMQLYKGVLDKYADKGRAERIKLISEDPYFHALQVKYAYAVTGHKSQGGQWDTVFIDQGFLTDEMLGQEYLRWLYTAITRASEKVYLVNFSPNFLVS